MNIHSAFALLLVLVALSLAATDRLKGASASSTAVKGTSSVAVDTDEAAPIGSYWLAWTEAAAH